MATARIAPVRRAPGRPAAVAATAPASGSAVLGGLPAILRKELVEELNKIERHFREGRWEPAELDGGRLCEIVYSIVRGQLDSAMPARAYKPADLVGEIKALERTPAAAGPRSMRITIPRVLLGIVEIRNDRDVGHVGGEVSPSLMDASYVVGGAKWLVAELIRFYHQVNTTVATAFVEALIVRDTPAVWSVADVKRVLVPGLSMRDRVLLLLDSTPGAVADTDLRLWSEYTNLSVFRRKVLAPLDDDALVHYDRSTGFVYLSPVGARYVSAKLPTWKA
jgi:hypothetical protein